MRLTQALFTSTRTHMVRQNTSLVRITALTANVDCELALAGTLADNRSTTRINQNGSTTIETPTFAGLLKQATEMLPEQASRLKQDLERNLRPLIESKLAELDLVTREEYDQQLALIERLEAQVAQLEEKLAQLSDAQS
ncbi:MAG: accessory factor UbiK family protein [Pseudomonadales bacterium]|nr:accessory factor UbiK family protein [Pseudomonadales bacterium]